MCLEVIVSSHQSSTDFLCRVLWLSPQPCLTAAKKRNCKFGFEVQFDLNVIKTPNNVITLAVMIAARPKPCETPNDYIWLECKCNAAPFLIEAFFMLEKRRIATSHVKYRKMLSKRIVIFLSSEA